MRLHALFSLLHYLSTLINNITAWQYTTEIIMNLKNNQHVEKEKTPNVIRHSASLFLGWDTRTRTRKGRTRICSVTITPYPNFLYERVDDKTNTHLFSSAKLLHFYESAKFFLCFFWKKRKKSLFWHSMTQLRPYFYVNMALCHICWQRKTRGTGIAVKKETVRKTMWAEEKKKKPHSTRTI